MSKKPIDSTAASISAPFDACAVSTGPSCSCTPAIPPVRKTVTCIAASLTSQWGQPKASRALRKGHAYAGGRGDPARLGGDARGCRALGGGLLAAALLRVLERLL